MKLLSMSFILFKHLLVYFVANSIVDVISNISGPFVRFTGVISRLPIDYLYLLFKALVFKMSIF